MGKTMAKRIIKPKTFLKPALGVLILCLAIPCIGNPDPELKAMRDLATSLLKQKKPASVPAYCEIATTRQSNECSGPDQLEDKLVIRSSGSVEVLTLRSWREDSKVKPGEYRGRIPSEKWKELLTAISKMEYVEGKSPRHMPMPGMSEGSTRMTLSDGKTTVKYFKVGRGQTQIENAFNEASWLGDSATDTLWALSLNPLSAKLRKGQLDFQAEWKVEGKSRITVSMPIDPADKSCGSSTLAWFHDKPETPGVTPLPVGFEYVKSSPSPGGDKWVAIDPKTPKKMSLLFSLPTMTKTGPKEGKVAQYGVLVKTTASAEPHRVTLFSELVSF